MRRTLHGSGILLALAVAAAFPSAALGSHAGPLAGEWHLDENVSLGDGCCSSPDSSGHGLDLFGEPGLGPGRFGNAMVADDVSDSYSREDPPLRPANPTLIAWVRAPTGPGDSRYVAGLSGSSCEPASYAMYTLFGGSLYFYVRTGPGSTVHSAPVSPERIWDGQWHMVAGTFDGAAVRIYLDGTEVASGAASASPVDYNLADRYFVIGDHLGNVACEEDTSFRGGIDEVRVYDRALTPTEIGRLAAATGPDPPTLEPDPPPPTPQCSDGVDNDGDGKFDHPADPGCSTADDDDEASTAPPPPRPPAKCADGQDNDGDGKTDHPADPGCSTADDNDETNPPAPPETLRPPRIADARSAKLKRATWLGAGDLAGAAGVRVEKYEWDFNNDGTYDGQCGGETPATSHPYRSRGPHTVGLRVTDNYGRSAVTKHTVRVPRAAVNTSRKHTSLYTCEVSIVANGPDPADCITTIAFSILEVERRGGSGQCFEVKSQPFFTEREGVKLVRGASVSRRYDKRRYNYVAKIDGPVAINGLPIPLPGRATTSYDSGKNTISLAGVDTWPFALPLPSGAPLQLFGLPLELAIKPTKGRFKLPPLKVKKIASFGGLKLGAGVSITLLDGAADVSLSVKLPDFLKLGFNKEAEGTLVVRTTNAGGVKFEGAEIKRIPKIFLGPIGVTDLYFNYRRTGDIWQGGANFRLGELAELKFAPPPYGIGLKGGRFDYAGAGIEFPHPPRPQIFPGVGLYSIGGSFGVNPIRFTGTVGVDISSVIVIQGSVFMGFPTEREPFDIPENFAPPGLGFLAGRSLDSTSFAVGGEAKLKVPVIGELPLANAYVFYAYPDYAELGGGFKFSLAKVASVEGKIGGFVSVGDELFNLEGSLKFCADLEITELCTGVEAVISSQGIGFCTTVPLPPFGIPVTVGVGYKWGGAFSPKFISCNLSAYKQARPAGKAAQAGHRFTLASGLPSAMVRVRGEGAPPEVLLEGPRGERILAGGDNVGALSEKVVVMPQTPESTLLIGLKDPSAGSWTITPREGSAAITGVATADGLRAPAVKASVSGSGQRRVLSYQVKPAPGQRVQFFERGGRTYSELGVARGSEGEIRFSSAPGRRERRKVFAFVERDGVVVKKLMVARYAAPGTARPKRPRALRVRRRGGGLAISWRRVRGAERYGVIVQLPTRTDIFRVTRQRRIFVARVDRRARGTVRVGALATEGVDGREAARRFR